MGEDARDEGAVDRAGLYQRSAVGVAMYKKSGASPGGQRGTTIPSIGIVEHASRPR